MEYWRRNTSQIRTSFTRWRCSACGCHKSRSLLYAVFLLFESSSELLLYSIPTLARLPANWSKLNWSESEVACIATMTFAVDTRYILAGMMVNAITHTQPALLWDCKDRTAVYWRSIKWSKQPQREPQDAQEPDTYSYSYLMSRENWCNSVCKSDAATYGI